MISDSISFSVGSIADFSNRINVYDYKLIKLELSASCNAKCKYCTMFINSNKPRGFLSYEDAKKFLNLNETWLIENNYSIEPFFNGESLLNPKFFNIVDIIQYHGCLLGDLDTNLGLNIDIERLANLSFRSITVNIGGTNKETHESVMGTDYSLVLNNLKRLSKALPKSVQLYIKMNPVRENINQISTLDDFVSQIGSNVLWKSQQTGITVPSDLNIKELQTTIDRIFDYENPEFFRFSIDETKTVTPKNEKCIYLSPCINTNGILTICAHDQLRHLNLGNVFNTPLSILLNSFNYKQAINKARNRYFPFCRGCN